MALASTPGSYSLTAAASDTALGIYGDAYTFGRAHLLLEAGSGQSGTLVLVTVHSSVAADVRAEQVNGTYAQGSSQVDFFNYNRSDGNLHDSKITALCRPKPASAT